MKHLNQYINIRKGKSVVKATDETIKQIVKDELDRLGHDADLNHIDVSEVKNMCRVFSSFYRDLGASYDDLNPDISKWNVSNVKDTGGMFFRCKKFNQDLSKWDVSKVENMRCMFYGCKSFNQDLSQWDVSKVENMYQMFWECNNFNQDLSGWDVSNVKHCNFMFNSCSTIKEEFKPNFVK